MGPLTIAVENLAQKAKKDSQLSLPGCFYHAENLLRNILVYMAITYTSYENKIITEYIGNISCSAIIQIKKHLEKRLIKEKILQEDLKKLKSLMLSIAT